MKKKEGLFMANKKTVALTVEQYEEFYGGDAERFQLLQTKRADYDGFGSGG